MNIIGTSGLDNSLPFEVSVIIPTYNRASLIGAAIQSVLDQTFKSVEIIVVDDGSTDDTQRALAPYAGKIASLVTENHGPAHARNVGMKAASGKYIAFLDSDDLYLPHKLELEVAFMEANPDIGMVSTNMSAMIGGEIVEEYHLDRYHSRIFHDYGWTLEDIYPVRDALEFHGESIPSYTGNIFKYMLHWPALFSNSVLFPRDILQLVGYQNEAYLVGEDYDYTARICKHFSVAFLDIPTYVYRYSEDQLTMLGSTWTTKRHATWIRILETVIQVALDHGEADTDYYSRNKTWLDPLLSRKYSELGRKLIDHGDSKKARECFSKAYDYGPSHENFFSKMLGDIDEPTAPFGLVDVQGDGSGIAEAYRPLDATLARRLREAVRALGVNAASVCHLAWALVLARVAARDDVVFGTVLFGRMQDGEGVDLVLGPFINTLPVRICVDEESAQSSVRHTHKLLAQLLRHEHAPLALAQRCSAVAAPAPLFSSLLSYRHDGAAEQTPTDTNQANAGTSYPLVLLVDDLGEGFALTARVQSSVDPQRICAYMHNALEQLVGALERAPATPLRSLDVLPEAERAALVASFPATRNFPCAAALHELFERQVERTPDAIALTVFTTDESRQELTYSELNQRANAVAHRLRAMGVTPNRLVGLRIERNAELVIGILAILKSGGAYLPLDPVYPPDRIAFMLEDARVSILLTQASLKAGLPALDATIICLDDPESTSPHAPSYGDMPRTSGPDDLAYVMYTSGSTGKPKGVGITHYNVARLFAATDSWYGFNASDVWTLFHSYAFDFSVWELWGALLYGGRVVLVPYWVSRSPEDFRELLVRERVTVLNQTPSAFRQLIQAEEAKPKADIALRYVIFGGEALELHGLRPWFNRYGDECPLLVNMYGITETTVHVTYRPIRLHDLKSGQGSVIGIPIPDLRVYILDPGGKLAPIGVPGEMYVGGAGVARGYLNRAELTAERFVADPFTSADGSRLYRTGDLARRLENGDIEYLGRIDHQVKIRGFRIELGEIEAGIARHPAIREVLVIAREDIPGDRRLVAYLVVANPPVDLVDQLRVRIRADMPEYMVPAHFVILDALPLTPNGKVDRKLLPAPDAAAYATRAYEAPVGEIETSLAQIWAEVLKLERVGRNDNFFELGGHSLLAAQVIFRARDKFDLQIPLMTIFEESTVIGFANYIATLDSWRKAREKKDGDVGEVERLRI